MEIFDSSNYVIERARQLGSYLASEKKWFVVAGKNNCILINLPSEDVLIPSQRQLSQILAEAYIHCKPTGLKRSVITYMFYHHLQLVCKVTVMPGSEYDVDDED